MKSTYFTNALYLILNRLRRNFYGYLDPVLIQEFTFEQTFAGYQKNVWNFDIIFCLFQNVAKNCAKCGDLERRFKAPDPKSEEAPLRNVYDKVKI